MAALVAAIAGSLVTSEVTGLIAGTALASGFLATAIPAIAGGTASVLVDAALPVRPGGCMEFGPCPS